MLLGGKGRRLLPKNDMIGIQEQCVSPSATHV
jgi:hypothetical protein